MAPQFRVTLRRMERVSSGLQASHHKSSQASYGPPWAGSLLASLGRARGLRRVDWEERMESGIMGTGEGPQQRGRDSSLRAPLFGCDQYSRLPRRQGRCPRSETLPGPKFPMGGARAGAFHEETRLVRGAFHPLPLRCQSITSAKGLVHSSRSQKRTHRIQGQSRRSRP